MIEVSITELKNAGSFLAQVSSGESYGEFMADLNNYYERTKSLGTIYVPVEGELCACYTHIWEHQHKLWYRGRVLTSFSNSSGFVVKCLLIDEGVTVCVTKQRMQKLEEKFCSFPAQVMNCILDGIQPITLSANDDYSHSIRQTCQWDSAATTYVEDFLQGKKTYLQTVSSNNEGLNKVRLYVLKDDDYINVNKVLVEKKYAVTITKSETEPANNTSSYQNKPLSKADLVKSWLQQEPSQEICPDSPVKESLTEPVKPYIVDFNTDTTPLTCKKLSKNVIPANPRSSLPALDKRRKQIQQNEANEQAQKNCEELLKILHGDSYMERNNETSGTSDLDDMETTPVPRMLPFQKTTSALKTKAFLEEKLDKNTSDMLAQAFGITGDETPKSTKKVTFSDRNQIFDLLTNDVEPGKPLSLDIDNALLSDKSHLEDEATLLSSISGSSMPLSFKGNMHERELFSKQVLVFGKRKVDPFVSVRELDLPELIRVSLKDFSSVSKVTPFQGHMWPAVSSLRNIVGIAEPRKKQLDTVLAYVLPIIKSIVEREIIYTKQGEGNGPFLLIFVNGWKEAQDTYDIIERLLTFYKKKIRVDVRYGGMDNEVERNIRLVNGCEVLITTIQSFNKALENGYSSVKRLAHVIFQSCSILVEEFTEDIKIFMRSYAEYLKNTRKPDVYLQQIIAVGSKWTDGMKSLMSSYMKDPLVIISNKIEMALFAKVPIRVEFCRSFEKFDFLMGCLQTDAIDDNTVVFTNTTATAEKLQLDLKRFGICAEVISEYLNEREFKDIKTQWMSQLNSPGNVLIISDNAVVRSGITNASFVINYEYPKRKSDFGKRLHTLSDTIKENENKDPASPLLCHVFVTEQNNEMRYSTGLVKLLKRSGQEIPRYLKSMAESAHEMKEAEKQHSDICPRLKLFGECTFIDDCPERHTIFPEKDMLQLCPSTGFVKVLILDVISASNFWGRIIEHRLPFAANKRSQFDPSLSSTLFLQMQEYYKEQPNRVLSSKLSKYDLCVTKSTMAGYQRVRIERIIEEELERPKKLEVFGIDSGLTLEVKSTDMFVLADEFVMIPPQAVEIVVCCVKPVEKGTSWTIEASSDVQQRIIGKTLEGRISFSLQNTIWVDPLVQKEKLPGIQTTTYSLDVARDLIGMGYGERNQKHVEKLRKLLYDVLGRPLSTTDDKKSLPYSMIDHGMAMLQDEDYEDVFVSAVVHPGLFFVQLNKKIDMIDTLDDKIDATMNIKKIDINDFSTVFPLGYICVAKFSLDDRWYRAKIVGINESQTEYEVFYVDHGEREWLHRSRVYESWPEILTADFEAIQCSFSKIRPVGDQWMEEDGKKFLDFVADKMFAAKVYSSEASLYTNDAVSYNIELYDTTCQPTMTISHELVYMGVAHGQLQCFLEMFPSANADTTGKVYKFPWDECPDLCLAIHLAKDLKEKEAKSQKLENIVHFVANTVDVTLLENPVTCICQLLALNKDQSVQIILLNCISHLTQLGTEVCNLINDHNAIKSLCNLIDSTEEKEHLIRIIETLMKVADDSWYYQPVNNHGFIKSACRLLEDCADHVELLKVVLDSLIKFCPDQELSCTTFRKEEGLEHLCEIFNNTANLEILDKIARLFTIVLSYWKNQVKMREIGGLQVLSSFVKKRLSPKALQDIIKSLLLCIENNIENKTYLTRMNVKDHIERYAKTPIPRTPEVRRQLLKVIEMLTPEIVNTTEEISSKFIPISPVKQEAIIETKTPMTVWSQRRNTVTLAVRIRGALTEETKVDGKDLYFRSVIRDVEYVLDLELYDEVSKTEKKTMIKGGEVLIVLHKSNPGVVWPRLLNSMEKHACISMDFDRWLDELTIDDTDRTDNKNFSFFKPGLPKPPVCQILKDNPVVNFPSIYPTSSISSDEESDDDGERLDDGPDREYMQI